MVSCYQYILSAIVLSVGPPFRQSMGHNRELTSIYEGCIILTATVPFVITMMVVVGISTYMLFDPAPWLYDLMELTWMSISFRGFIVVLALGSFSCSYLAERLLFPRLSKWIGQAYVKLRPQSKKKRKEYKVVLESMRI